MTEEKHELVHLADALLELNQARLEKDAAAACYAQSTAYGFAAAGRIPTERRGRAYFVRRSDLPLIASRLPLGRRRRAAAPAV